MAEYNILGVDIGGTKCAVIYGRESDGELTIVEKVKFPTAGVDETIARIVVDRNQLWRSARQPDGGGHVTAESAGLGRDSHREDVERPVRYPGWNP